MKATADLHLHTFYSDGLESPSVVVQRAAKMGYKTVSVTDHDGITGVAEAVREGERLGIKVIPGIEFSTEYTLPDLSSGGDKTYKLHLLGYGLDIDNAALKEEVAKCLLARDERNRRLIEWFSANGVEMTEEELGSESPNQFIGKMSFARLLVKRGLCKDTEEAHRSAKFLANPEVKAIKKKRIDTGHAIEVLGKAGALSVMAHPFQMSYSGKNMESAESFKRRIEFVISCLAGEGMMGIEAYYPTHTEEQVRFLLSIADYFGLKVSRGSDDHGEGARPIMKMGDFAVEPDASRLTWITG